MQHFALVPQGIAPFPRTPLHPARLLPHNGGRTGARSPETVRDAWKDRPA